MDALVRSGKVRYWGVSNHTGEQVSKLVELSKGSDKAAIAGTEDLYNIIARDIQQHLFPVLRRAGLGLMAYSPLAAGKLAPGRTADAGTPQADILAALDKVARELGVTRSQVATAWVLSHREVTSVIAGSERPEHVDDNFAGTKLMLPKDAIAALNAASDVYLRRTKKEKTEG